MFDTLSNGSFGLYSISLSCHLILILQILKMANAGSNLFILKRTFLLRRIRQCYCFFGRTRKDLKVYTHSILPSLMRSIDRKSENYNIHIPQLMV